MSLEGRLRSEARVRRPPEPSVCIYTMVSSGRRDGTADKVITYTSLNNIPVLHTVHCLVWAYFVLLKRILSTNEASLAVVECRDFCSRQHQKLE